MDINKINEWAGKIKSKRMTQKKFCEENDISLVDFRKLLYSANDLSSTKTQAYDAVEKALEK